IWLVRYNFIAAFFHSLYPPPHSSNLFPYTTLFRSPKASSGTAARAASRLKPARSSSHCSRRRSRKSATPRSSSKPARSTALSSRSEEHTSELQSRRDLVCRLLLEKKKKITHPKHTI